MPGNVGILSDQTRELPKPINLDEFVSAHRDFEIEQNLATSELNRHKNTDLSERVAVGLYELSVLTSEADEKLKTQQTESQNSSELGQTEADSSKNLAQKLGFSSESAGEKLIDYSKNHKNSVEFKTHKIPELLLQDLEQIFIFKNIGHKLNYRINKNLDRNKINMTEEIPQPNLGLNNPVNRIQNKFTLEFEEKERMLTDRKVNNQIVFWKENTKLDTLITVSLKTDNKMTAWNSNMQMERIQKIEEFVKLAQDISFLLIEEGYFCDFIDPNTGKPWFARQDNGSDQELVISETNDNFGNLANFDIKDLGCCKVLREAL